MQRSYQELAVFIDLRVLTSEKLNLGEIVHQSQLRVLLDPCRTNLASEIKETPSHDVRTKFETTDLRNSDDLDDLQLEGNHILRKPRSHERVRPSSYYREESDTEDETKRRRPRDERWPGRDKSPEESRPRIRSESISSDEFVLIPVRNEETNRKSQEERFSSTKTEEISVTRMEDLHRDTTENPVVDYAWEKEADGLVLRLRFKSPDLGRESIKARGSSAGRNKAQPRPRVRQIEPSRDNRVMFAEEERLLNDQDIRERERKVPRETSQFPRAHRSDLDSKNSHSSIRKYPKSYREPEGYRESAGVLDSPWPIRGKTKMSKKAVSVKVLDELGYPYREEVRNTPTKSDLKLTQAG